MKPVAGTGMETRTGQHQLVVGNIMTAGRGEKGGPLMAEKRPAGT
jgi:hypothetical protein